MQHCCAVCDALAAGVLFCLGCYYVFLCSRCCQEKQLLWDHPAGAGNANPSLQSTRHCFNPGDRERRLQPSGTLVVQLRKSPSLACLLTSLRRNLKTSHSKNVSSSISSRIQGSSLPLPGVIPGHGIFNPVDVFMGFPSPGDLRVSDWSAWQLPSGCQLGFWKSFLTGDNSWQICLAVFIANT